VPKPQHRSGRICANCGRWRYDPEFHATEGQARYCIGLRLIATSPVSGKTFVPRSPQRLKSIDNRFVREQRFEPGGDLHAIGPA
jgi:hypothetical protein